MTHMTTQLCCYSSAVSSSGKKNLEDLIPSPQRGCLVSGISHHWKQKPCYTIAECYFINNHDGELNSLMSTEDKTLDPSLEELANQKWEP